MANLMIKGRDIGDSKNSNVVVNGTDANGESWLERCMTNRSVCGLNYASGYFKPAGATATVPNGKAFYVSGSHSPNQLVSFDEVSCIDCYGPITITTTTDYLRNSVGNMLADIGVSSSNLAKLVIPGPGGICHDGMSYMPEAYLTGSSSYTLYLYPGSSNTYIPMSRGRMHTVNVTYAYADISGNEYVQTLKLTSSARVHAYDCKNITTLHVTGGGGLKENTSLSGCTSIRSVTLMSNAGSLTVGGASDAEYVYGWPSTGTLYINYDNLIGVNTYRLTSYHTVKYVNETRTYTVTCSDNSRKNVGFGKLFTGDGYAWNIVNTGNNPPGTGEGGDGYYY